MKIAEHLRHAEVTAVGDESLIALPQRVLDVRGLGLSCLGNRRTSEEELGAGQMIDDVSHAPARATR
jgi:hypothetical protein